MENNVVPVEKNKSYVMDIRALGHEGEGIGRIEDFTVFVPGTLPEEKVRVLIIKVTKSYAVGKLVEILKPSPSRVTPACSAYKRCGGCSLQHMDYKAQLDYKTQKVRDNIERIGKITGCVIHPTIGMDKPMNYRNKVQLPVAVVKGEAAIGFYAMRSHDIIELEQCDVQHGISGTIVQTVKAWMKEFKIPAYDEAAGTGIVRHLMIRNGFSTGEIMVVLVTNGTELPHGKEIIERLKQRVPGLKSVIQNINRKKTNVVLGEQNKTLYGNATITDYIGKFKFKISANSFFQVNPVQTEVLYGKALDYAGLTGDETVFDLYCGIGTISLFLAQKAKKVYGIEVVPEAVEDARQNARDNGVENIEFIEGEAEEVFPELYKKGHSADVVVLDPPRKGCEERLLKTLVDMQPEKIVYVSCNPSTLARDLNFLDQNGYKAKEVQPVDMFPWTWHVECVALITKYGLEGK